VAQLSPSLDITAGLDSGTSARISRTGAGLRSLHWRGVPVVPDYPGDDRPLHAGAVLFPWAGRLPDGEWKDHDHTRTLALNDELTHSALHGLVCDEEFEVVAASDCSLTLSHTLSPTSGYPYSLRLDITYDLSDEGLSVTDRVTNEGSQKAPFGLAHHPYLSVGNSAWEEIRLEAVVSHRVPTTPRLVPHRVEPLPSGLTEEMLSIAPEGLDETYALPVHPGERSWLRLITAETTLTLWQDSGWPWLHIYGTDSLPGALGFTKAVALEPHTSLPNSLNWLETVVSLEPGDSWQGSWGIAFRETENTGS